MKSQNGSIKHHKILKPHQKHEVILYAEKIPGLSHSEIAYHFSRVFKTKVIRRTISNILKFKIKMGYKTRWQWSNN